MGYASNTIAQFDIKRGGVVNSFSTPVSQFQGQQINKIDCHPTLGLVASAHEGGELSLFDFNSSKSVKVLPGAHGSPSIGASAVLFTKSGLEMLSGAHDGSVKVWDLRTYRPIQEIEGGVAHQRKYGEGVTFIAEHPEAPFFGTGGADCLVNLYELNPQ